MGSKLVLITGASKGLGLSVSKVFLNDDDDTVVNLSRSDSPLTHKNLANCNIDLANTDNIEKSVVDILRPYKNQTWSSVTFINSAATIAPVSDISEIDTGELIAATNINHIAPVILFKHLLKSFGNNKNLILVNVSSGAANANISGWAVYSSLKAANNRFMENMADEHQDSSNIRFMIFNPGIMDTSMQQEIRDSDFRDRAKFVDFKNNGNLRPPEVVANHLVNLLLQNQFDLYQSM